MLFFLLFIDDTSLTHTDVKLGNVTQARNSELEKLTEWLQSNKLSLNIDKTISMIMSTKGILIDKNGDKLLSSFTFDGEPIQQKFQLNI